MGALTDFFSDSDTAKSSPITEQLLDNLYKTESSRNPKAVNEKSGALGGYQFLPSTVEMLAKKGIKFNPMNEPEARNAARTYLEMLTEQNGGDVRKALAQYGGFVKEDPTDYINKVMGSTSSKLADFFADVEPEQIQGAGAGRGSYAGYNPILAREGVTGHQVGNPIQNLKSQIIADQNKESVGAVAGDLLKTLVTGVQAPIVGAITGKIAELRSPQFGTPQGARVAEEQFRNYLNQTMHQPETQTGKNIIDYLGQIPEKITGSSMGFGILPEAQAISTPAAAVANRAAAPLIPIMGKIGQVAGEVKNPFRTTLAEHLAQMGEQAAPQTEKAVTAGSVGAKAVNVNPLKGEISGEETAKGELYPTYKFSKTSNDVPEREQNIRAEIAHEINPSGQVREGVKTGNEQTLRNEHALAKSADRTPEGELLSQQIAQEQTALSDYAQKRIAATGASPTLINDEQRGIRINDVFHGTTPEGEEPTSLKGFLDQAKQKIYDDAKAKHGDIPVTTSHVDELFDNPRWKATLELRDTSGVASGAQKLIQLAKEVGFEDQNGTMHPAGSVGAFDAVRKAINADWSQSKASTIRDINQAIDKDIASVADPKLYKLGDRIHEAEKKIYETKGIERLFGETDQNGIVKSTTPLEKIPSKLNNLRKDEWRHVRDTLVDLSNGIVRGAPEGLPPVPESLRNSAKAAVAEIDGALAREVYKAGAGRAGVWNQNDVRDVLNSTIGEKIHETFPPNEVLRFQILNAGGHLMPGVHSYEGGAAQQVRLNMLNRNLGTLGASAGSAAGGYLFGPYGATIGAGVGGYAGKKAEEGLLLSKLAKNAEKAQKQMQENAARPKILKLRSEK
jgi:hypothetical protein